MSKDIANNKIQANSLADNKIKAKPEVGDVFENGYGNKILITKVWDFNNEDSYADCVAQTWRSVPFYLEVRHIPLKDFEFLTYIGKSTKESKELFDVEEK